VRPRCFESNEQFKLWMAKARESKAPPEHGYCFDCTQEYQYKMILDGRCEYPGTTFKWFRTTRTNEGVKFVEEEYGGIRPLAHVLAVKNSLGLTPSDVLDVYEEDAE
jgi:hypothetical protein